MTPRSNKIVSSAIRPMIDSLEARQLRTVDLQVAAVTVDEPIITSVGQSFELNLDLYNAGNTATTKSTFVHLFLTRDDIVGNADDIQLSTKYYSASIPAKGHAILNVKTGTGISQPSGVFKIGAEIDSVHLVAESNENNNTTLSAPGALTIAEFLDKDSILGTAGNDVIELSVVSSRAIMVVNGKAWSRPIGFFGKHLFIDAGAGNDKVIATPDFNVKLAITGSSGNDTIVGGLKDDELAGGNGRDKIYGGGGWDFLIGASGSDFLFGEAGRDTISGGNGNDRLYSGAGTDILLGGLGDDILNAQDGTADYRDSIYGGDGADTSVSDNEDILSSCETTTTV